MSEAVGAMSAPISAQVRQAIEFIRTNIGEGNKVTLKWDRTGARLLPLLGGDRKQWTVENLFGKLGEFSATAPGSLLPVTEASCFYRVLGDDLEVTPKVLIRGLAAKLAPASNAVGAPVDNSVGFGAMTILTVFQVAYGLFQLLHPSVNLELPGNIELSFYLTGGSIVVDFVNMPTIRIDAWVHLDLGVKKATIIPTNAHIEFVPNGGFFSGFVKSRDVALT